MAELIGVELLNERIEYFLADLGYNNICCDLDIEFSYIYERKTSPKITYSFFSEPITDRGFKKYLEDTFGSSIPYCSIFTISLLHELGHHITIPRLSKKRLEKAIKEKERLENNYKGTTDRELSELQYNYCKLYIERIATKKAIQIIRNNREKIEDFEKDFFNAVERFYKINNITWE